MYLFGRSSNQKEGILLQILNVLEHNCGTIDDIFRKRMKLWKLMNCHQSASVRPKQKLLGENQTKSKIYQSQSLWQSKMKTLKIFSRK